jgi:putative membrane protein
VTPAERGAPAAVEETAGTPWQRLSIRVIWLNLLRAAISCVPGYLGGVVLNDDGPVWPLVAASVAGVLQAVADLGRWATTRYRVTAERVEMRSGWAARRYRTVARDRIRSVDSTAKLLPRLLRLRVVHIGSGEAESSFKLNALDRTHAARLHDELLRKEPVPQQHEEGDAIARLRWRWIPLNIVTVWAAFVVAGPLFSLYWFLRPFGVDLLDVAGTAVDRGSLGLFWSVALAVVVAYPIGVAGLAGVFLLENWGFVLSRTGGALVSRRGLLTTRTVQRDESRLRGLAVKEPLIWRWLHVAETSVVTTGGAPGGAILPRLRLAEAREVAARILPDGERPLEAALRRHPRGALIRRLGWALYPLVAASAATRSLLPLAALPLTLALAVAAYRSLGHAVAGPYVVVRRGAVNRNTVALQRGAVIGWTVRQSLLQRWGDRMTVGIPTAAGERYYQAPDVSVEQALTLILQVSPESAAQFIAPRAHPAPTSRPDRPTG